jgi:hypothetical protein
MIRVTNRLAVFALSVVLVGAALAGASRAGGSDTLQLSSIFLKAQASNALTACPSGTPATSNCWSIDSAGVIRGLGNVTESGLLIVDDVHTTCEKWHATPALTVAGKGTIQLALLGPPCISDPNGNGVSGASMTLTVTGGTGSYASASGSGTDVTDDASGIGLNGSDTLSGNITAPNTTFDLTPPVITVKAKQTVRAPKGAKRVRVRYTATAQDAVDGSVPVKCRPRSGRFFKAGRTRVTCTATDSSANAATKRFTVTVKRRR